MSTIKVRPGRPQDTAAMLEITQGVWNGTDYVPLVWGEWLGGAAGSLLVATIDGQVVGLQHVAIQPDGGAWMEGIRVAEQARGQGVGEALIREGMRWARNMGCRIARLSIAGNNPSSIKLAQKAGFHATGTFQTATSDVGDIEPDTLPAPAWPVRVALPEDDGAVTAFLGHRGFSVPDATYTEGWTAYRLTKTRLRLLLATHAVILAGGHATEAMAIATSPPDRPSLRLGLVAGSSQGVEALGRFLRRRAAEALLDRIRVTVEADDKTMDALSRAGFRRGEVKMLLRERSLA